MKRLLIALVVALLTGVGTAAQSRQDFADKFLSLYGKEHELHCQTISPQMMQRILQLDDVAANKQTLHVLSQMRSLRILRSLASATEARDLFAKARQLAVRNKRRYTIRESDDLHSVYVRRRDKRLVEVVVTKIKEGNKFYMIDLTGNLSDDFIQQILRI